MSSMAAGLLPSVCRVALAPLPHRRTFHQPVDLIEIRRKRDEQILHQAYDGLLSYAEFTSARRLLDSSSTDRDLLDDAAAKMAPCA